MKREYRHKKWKREYRHLRYNTGNDLPNKVKFENCVIDEINCFIKQNISFLFSTKIYFILGDRFYF